MAIDQLTADCLAQACAFRPEVRRAPASSAHRRWVDDGIPGDLRSGKRRETDREMRQRQRSEEDVVVMSVEEAAFRNAQSHPALQHLVDELRRTEPSPERTYELRALAMDEGNENVHHVLLCTDRRVVYSRVSSIRGVQVLAVYPHGALDVRGKVIQRRPELHAGPPAVLEWPRVAGEEGVLDLGVRHVMNGPSPYLANLMHVVANRPPMIRLNAGAAAVTTTAATSPAAWHPDPTGRHEHRWWDGTRWTEHAADTGGPVVDPI